MNAYKVTKASKDYTTEEKRAAIVYLSEEKHETPRTIASLTGYAVQTVRTYAKKFIDLLESAKTWFSDSVARAAKRVERVTIPRKKSTDNWCAYIIEFFDSDNQFTFLKIGLTNNFNRRMKEHLSNKQYKNDYDIQFGEVKEIFSAENKAEVEEMERKLRAHYRAKKRNGFVKNDRFTGCRYHKEDVAGLFA